MSLILGIYHPAAGVGHDASVALVTESGQVVAACSEERFSRVKMDGGFPFRAYEALQRMVRFAPRDLSCVAIPFMSSAQKAGEGSRLLWRSLRDPDVAAEQLRYRFDGDRFQAGMEQIGAYRYFEEYLRAVRAVHARDGRPDLADWRDFLRYSGLRSVPLTQVDHHVAHAAGAYYTSGWDEALLVTCDGLGGLKSSIVAVGRRGKMRSIARTFYPHSAGRFWEAVTAISGFHHMKHGGKITGLAASGDPAGRSYRVLEPALSLDGMSIRSDVDPVRMAKELEGCSREDIAAAAQRRLEEIVVELVRRAVNKTGLRRVGLSGGVFSNVRLNQRIAEIEGIEEVYVYPAMGDEGLAVGAALWAAARRSPLEPRRWKDLYLGTDYTEAEMEEALREHQLPYQRHSDRDLAEKVADFLTRGRTVGLCRGRMEFGPRALGHRTILYHARDQTVNDWLNERLARSEFMPFAPVTLEEHAERCYGNIANRRYTAQFMTVTCDCTGWMREVSPAVVHRDNSARPQLVGSDTDPFTYDILQRYFQKTGIPSLINTSFNMHEEPIVCDPGDAVRAFLRARLDSLVMGPFLAVRDEGPAER